MPGSSQRRGAVRKGGKAPAAGSGGRGRRALEGKGPTPKAVDREYHPAHRRAKATARRAGGGSRGTGARGPTEARGTRSTRRGRGTTELVAGRNSVVEALRAGVPVTAMYVATRIDSDDRVRESLRRAAELGLPILETPRPELDRLTDGAVHQGIALQVPPYDYADPHDLIDPEAPGVPLVVALDGITDPRNLGAIVRSVAAFGGHGVLLPERRSAGMTAAAWKTSAGAAARVPVARATNLTRTLEEFKKAGFFVVGLDMRGDVELPDLPLADSPLVVVTGSEGKGLSRLVRETCDQVVSIPMSSAVESLNAGMATGVALYEIARQRRA
ncbi:23S rRNA (guanosine(2251)-2'-O)-methyltransferase RlmB [Intrasporangium sp.]|uniref:23S rRNA (guanosine(2251)-2'-O)-methyltransferase RlmB n=1 Tax=Intrasporangium sp. TaxID=1925024 RepID=UPI003221D585